MSQKPKICLSMIVKNEAHVIKQTLENISKYIDYYVINDTGSTDNTREIIKEYFDSINIPGEIIDHEFRTCTCHPGNKWKKYSFFHFGWNRSYALSKCVGKSDYIFVFDADDLIVGNMNLDNLTDDCYNLRIGKGFTYVRPLIFKNDSSFNWHFEDPLHEFATCDKNDYSKGTIKGDYFVDSRRLGARNQDKNKYLRDALVFEELLKENPNNERHMFYCAQSYYDHKDYESAIKFYNKRISAGKWYEEVFYSYYKIALALQQLKRPWGEIKKAFLDAHNYCKDRAEPLYEIAQYYRSISNYSQAYKYAKMAAQIPYPEKCTLFIYKDIYDYRILEELAYCASHLEKYHEAYGITQKLLNLYNDIPQENINNIKKIMNNSKNKIDQMKKKTCLIYTGNMTINRDSVLFNLLKLITKTHKTIIVGNKIDIYSYKDTFITSTKNMKDVLTTQLDLDYFILCDTIDCYYENLNINAKTTILLQQNQYIKNIFENGFMVGIKNSEYLNKIFEKLNIKRIICHTQNTADKLVKLYNLDKTTVDHIDFEDESNYHVLLDNTQYNYTFNLDVDNDTNGLIYIPPHCIEHMKSNKQSYAFTNQLILNYYTEIQKKQPYMLEHLGKLAQVYHELGDNEKALSNLNMVTSLIKENKSYQSYKDMIQLIKADILSKTDNSKEAYDVCNLILQKNIIPQNQRAKYEILRDQIAAEHLFNEYAIYPQNTIAKLKKNYHPLIKNILFVMSVDIGDIYEKTLNSFVNCCTDLSKIDNFLCICESKDIKTKINKKYPWFDYVIRKNNTAWNTIRETAISEKYKYILCIPPKWQFIQKRDYITECLDIIESDNMICQVSLNKLTQNVEVKTTSNNTRYIQGQSNELGLSLLNVSALNNTGIFCNTDNQEQEYISELIARNYKITSIDTISAINLLSLEKNVKINSSNLSIKVISDGKDINIWKRFKDSLGNQTHISKIIPQEKIKLDDEERQLFLGNDFSYLRSVIGKILPHIKILQENSNNYTLVLNEKVVLKKDYKSILNTILNSKETYDFIVLDNTEELESNSGNIIRKDIPINLEKSNGYIISKEGKKKLLNYIMTNKIRTINYLENQNVVDTYVLTKSIYDTIEENDQEEVTKTSFTELHSFVEFPGYKFYSLMDSFGNDSGSYGKLSLEELKEKCESSGSAGFNTLGWTKHTINPEKDFIILPNTTNPADGLYVKI